MFYLIKATALNLPRLTRAAGTLLILAVGGIHLYLAPAHFAVAAYMGVGFLGNFAASLVAALGIWLGAKNWGWLLGAYVAGGALVAYLVTRSVGIEGFQEAEGNWANAWGTFAMMVEGLYLATYVAVATGWAVAAPDERYWHD